MCVIFFCIIHSGGVLSRSPQIDIKGLIRLALITLRPKMLVVVSKKSN